MGGAGERWTVVEATHIKPNGEVDRAEEVRAYYERHVRGYTLVEAAVVGATVYCLVADEDGEKSMHVCRTAATGHAGRRWLAIGVSDESRAYSLANVDSCPKRLLACLAAPRTEQSAAWRRMCHLRAARNAECRRAQRAGRF